MHDSQGLGPAGAGLIEVAARLLVVELDSAALIALQQDDLSSVLDQFEPGTSSYLKTTAGDAAAIEELAAEFCRLFLMSKATSPLLSVWMEGDALENASRMSAKVDNWQAQLGVQLEAGPWGNLPREHLATSLGLYALALVSGERNLLAREIAELALLPTLPRFTAAVLTHTTNPIYRAGMRLLSEVVGTGPVHRTKGSD